MKTVVADTFYFFALVNPADQAHHKAVAFLKSNPVRIVTTEWVLVELADGLAGSVTGRAEFRGILADLCDDPDSNVIPSDRELFDAGVRLYAQRPDKKWSLTDCISMEVMREMHLIEALTGDKHFEQAGFIALLA